MARKVEQRRSLRELREQFERKTGRPVKSTELVKLLADHGFKQSDDDPSMYVRTVVDVETAGEPKSTS